MQTKRKKKSVFSLSQSQSFSCRAMLSRQNASIMRAQRVQKFLWQCYVKWNVSNFALNRHIQRRVMSTGLTQKKLATSCACAFSCLHSSDDLFIGIQQNYCFVSAELILSLFVLRKNSHLFCWTFQISVFFCSKKETTFGTVEMADEKD